MKSKIFTCFMIVALSAIFITSCKKESIQQNVASKAVKTFDKSFAIKNIDNFAAFVNKKKTDRSSNLKTNTVQNENQLYGLEYMSDNYGDPGVNAYYLPSPVIQQSYNPVYITTDDDFNNATPQALSQKVNSDLSSYLDVNGVTSASNTSPALQANIDGFTNALKGIATSEMDKYIYGLVDTTNFNEDDYYNSIKSKTSQAISNYISNIGNSPSLNSYEQMAVLNAATNASQLINTVDMRGFATYQDNTNLAANSIKTMSDVRVKSFFSSIVKVVAKVAKVVAAVVVTLAVAVVAGVIGFAICSGLVTIDPSYNPDAGLGKGITAFGGFVYGFDQMYFKTNLWKWAGVRK